MNPHPYLLTACVKRPGVLIRHDQASLACTLGLMALANAYVHIVSLALVDIPYTY